MSLISTVTGAFTGNWIVYAAIGLALSAVVAMTAVKVTHAFDAETLAKVQHSLDVDEGSIKQLNTAIVARDSQIARDKADSDKRVTAAVTAQKAADAKAVAAGQLAHNVLIYNEHPDDDLANTLGAVMEGIK